MDVSEFIKHGNYGIHAVYRPPGGSEAETLDFARACQATLGSLPALIGVDSDFSPTSHHAHLLVLHTDAYHIKCLLERVHDHEFGVAVAPSTVWVKPILTEEHYRNAVYYVMGKSRVFKTKAWVSCSPKEEPRKSRLDWLKSFFSRYD